MYLPGIINGFICSFNILQVFPLVKFVAITFSVD